MFMKLHGWERPETPNGNLEPININKEVQVKKWNLWRIANEKLAVEVQLSGIVDFSDYFSKFKSDLSFSILDNYDGIVFKTHFFIVGDLLVYFLTVSDVFMPSFLKQPKDFYYQKAIYRCDRLSPIIQKWLTLNFPLAELLEQNPFLKI